MNDSKFNVGDLFINKENQVYYVFDKIYVKNNFNVRELSKKLHLRSSDICIEHYYYKMKAFDSKSNKKSMYYYFSEVQTISNIETKIWGYFPRKNIECQKK